MVESKKSESKVEKTVVTAKRAKAKSSKKATAAKEPKPKRERKPKEEGLMVFAFRLSKPESEALHKAAGPANASRTMRALAAAFAAEDPDAFKAVLVEAKKLRA